MTRPTAADGNRFRALMDEHGRPFGLVADASGYSYGAIRKFYYGERRVTPRALECAEALAYRNRHGSDRVGVLVGALETATSALNGTITAAVREVDQERLELRAAIDAMCRACDASGICRITDCPLRPVTRHLRVKEHAA